MYRKFKEQELLIASNNSGKILEITELLSPYNIKVFSTKDLQVEDPEETGSTFIENAKLKAEYYGKIKNIPALADDSGISIKELDNFPGIYSARIAGKSKNFYDAFDIVKQKLLEKGLHSSPAFFTCALALWWPDGHFETFEGEWHGNLTFPPRGSNGFGYDPIFIPEREIQTVAEMTKEEKNKVSHRAVAFNKLINACFIK